MTIDLLDTLRSLVAIPSVNPMGRVESVTPLGEAALTDHLERWFHQLGLQTRRQPVLPGRANLIARIDGETPPEHGGPLILFDAHQDTVPVDNMTIEPWTPAVRDGRLYGRGACDTKGGMAAMLAVLARLVAERPRGMPTVVMTCTVDEEYGFSGIRALVAAWASDLGQSTPHAPREESVTRSVTSTLFPRAPDAAVVAEPTGLDVVVAHKGVVRWRCHTIGRAAHSARPDTGENAIYKMAPVLSALDRYQRDVTASLPGHPLCGPRTLNVGTIRGGLSVNTVPDRCSIEIDLRLPPGLTPEAARADVVDYLAKVLPDGAAPVHDPPDMQGPPLSDNNSGPLAERLSNAVLGVVGSCERRAVPYATNAAFFSEAGTPAVVFGPGSAAQAHTADEWLPLGQLEQAAEILYRFVVSYGS